MNVKIIILVFIFLNDAIADDNLNIKLYDKLDMKFKSIPGSGPPEVENANIQCSNEHNLNKDLADENLLNDTIEISENEKCYWKCVLKNMGSMEENGNLSDKPHSVFEQFSAEYSGCLKNTTGVDDCDKAYKFTKCIVSKTLEKYKRAMEKFLRSLLGHPE